MEFLEAWRSKMNFLPDRPLDGCEAFGETCLADLSHISGTHQRSYAFAADDTLNVPVLIQIEDDDGKIVFL